MTPHQWIFHYIECQRHKREENKKEKAILNILERFATYSHPSIDLGKLDAQIKQRHIEETVKEVKDDIEEQAAILMQNIPRKISVKEDKKEQKPILKTMKVPTKRKRKNDLGKS